ncbi:fimbrial biogenesis chaperone [Tsuneonella sp. HG222]
MTRAAAIMLKTVLTVAGGSFAFLVASATQAQSTGQLDLGSAGANTAAALNITPLRFEFDAGETTATMRLTNTSSRTMPVQTRIFAWTQSNGEDQYALSSDLAVSPSITSIPPGQTQIVRVVRRSAASQGEKRFRLAVDQLPDPEVDAQGGASALIRFTLPVFTDRETAEPARLAWRIASDRLELANNGGQTSRIVSMTVTTLDGREVEVERNSLRYVQGNSTITWPLNGGCALGRIKISAQLDGQMVDVEPESLCS